MFEFLNYGFVFRGIEAGIIIALIAPLIGIFLVLRRYSLIVDTLSHVSLAGVAIGLLFKINPLVAALATTTLSSIGIERLRASKKVYGESALALFLSSSLGLAIVLIGLAHGFTVDLFSYLFGSITTVTQQDVYTIALVGITTLILVLVFFKELVFVTFDEDAAQVSGVNVWFINALLIVLTAVTITIAIPIVGILLISSLVVIPVLTSLRLKKNFVQTILYAQVLSVLSVLLGIYVSYVYNIATGGTIVLINVLFFLIVLATEGLKKNKLNG